MNHPDASASYMASVVTLYLQMPDTPMRVSVSDQWLARHFHQDGIPLRPSKLLCCWVRCED